MKLMIVFLIMFDYFSKIERKLENKNVIRRLMTQFHPVIIGCFRGPMKVASQWPLTCSKTDDYDSALRCKQYG